MVSFYEVQGKAVETRYSSLKARHHRCVYDAYLSILTSYIPIFNRRNIQNYNYFRPYVIICLTSYKRKLQNSASSFSHYHFIVVICAHRKRANSRLKNLQDRWTHFKDIRKRRGVVDHGLSISPKFRSVSQKTIRGWCIEYNVFVGHQLTVESFDPFLRFAMLRQHNGLLYLVLRRHCSTCREVEIVRTDTRFPPAPGFIFFFFFTEKYTISGKFRFFYYLSSNHILLRKNLIFKSRRVEFYSVISYR